MTRWRTLTSDADAQFDKDLAARCRRHCADGDAWGNRPGRRARRSRWPRAKRSRQRLHAGNGAKPGYARAVAYMGLVPGMALSDIAIDRAFIGSCTNGRIEDLEAAANVVRGRKVAASVQAWVVPGSTPVKAQAEARGLDRVFKEAGFQWREAGCSMCCGDQAGDVVAPGPALRLHHQS